MELQTLSNGYRVARIQEKDFLAVYELCKGNPQYYQYCPPEVSIKSIQEDSHALPKGSAWENKYYLGFWEKESLVAVMDLIVGYPEDDTAYIGFFMLHRDWQHQGTGSKIVGDVFTALQNQYKRIKLGCVKGNKQSELFWKKNGFLPTGAITQSKSYQIVSMQKELSPS